jgi:RNA polymerase sigma-70 factor (ECF subfamily)
MNGERTATTDDDCRFVARFMRGDKAAFDSLFVKYQDYVYNIVYGIVGSAEEARDLSQEVFVQVYRSLPKFRQGARFATWLYRIAVNRAVDAARGSRRWRFLPILDVPSIMDRTADAENEPESVFVRGEERDAIQRVLMQCPLNHRDVLVLRYYRGLSVEEIAETLDCSISAAKVRLHRARRVFKEYYVAAPGMETAACSVEGAQNHVG